MLPSINVPIHAINLPSNNKEINIRPYTVQEEKILLTAAESRDPKQIILAMRQTTQNCLDVNKNKIDIEDLPDIDLQYIFLQLRVKSVSETSNVALPPQCGEQGCPSIKVEIDLNSVEVEKSSDHTNKIMLTDNLGVVLRYPSLKIIESIKAEKEIDAVYETIASLVDFVFDQENVYKDFTKTEMIDWISKLSTSQFKKIRAFFDTQPKLVKKVDYVCEKCGKTGTFRLEGVLDFFM